MRSRCYMWESIIMSSNNEGNCFYILHLLRELRLLFVAGNGIGIYTCMSFCVLRLGNMDL
jgi:hypothetical protein